MHLTAELPKYLRQKLTESKLGDNSQGLRSGEGRAEWKWVWLRKGHRRFCCGDKTILSLYCISVDIQIAILYHSFVLPLRELGKEYLDSLCSFLQVHTLSCSVMSNSFRLHGLCSPLSSSVHGDSPGKNTGVGCHALLQVQLHMTLQWSQSKMSFKVCYWISSVTQSCPTLCDPMDCSTPGFPVHHQLPELTQTPVHWVSDAIQPSHPLSSPSPLAFNHSQHQGLFKWVSSSHQVAKVLEFQLQHRSFQWFRPDFL